MRDAGEVLAHIHDLISLGGHPLDHGIVDAHVITDEDYLLLTYDNEEHWIVRVEHQRIVDVEGLPDRT